MAHEVIMPALGMAQSSGRLVRWLKTPGSAVRAGETLFEVETDKTTMEVDAEVDGYLTAVDAEAGQDVPVGQVIARISAGAEETVAAALLPAAPDPVAPAPASGQAVLRAAAPVPPVPDGVPPSTPVYDRILASPKLRRMASAEGLDLTMLARAGHPQPYHAADLALLREFSVPVPVPAPAPARSVEPSLPSLHLSARVPRAGSDAFVDRVREQAGIALERHSIWLTFAAAAWRAVRSSEHVLVLELRTPGAVRTRWLDPDRGRLSAQRTAADAAPELIVRDLTGTFLTALRTPSPAVPVLTIADDGDTLRLSLDATAGTLSEEAAVDLLTFVARALNDPLPHLV